MGQALQTLQSAGTGQGGMGPANQAMAINSPTPEMVNTSRGMDPTQGASGAAPAGQAALNSKTQMAPAAPNPAITNPHTMTTLPNPNPFANPDPRSQIAQQLFSTLIRRSQRPV